MCYTTKKPVRMTLKKINPIQFNLVPDINLEFYPETLTWSKGKVLKEKDNEKIEVDEEKLKEQEERVKQAQDYQINQQVETIHKLRVRIKEQAKTLEKIQNEILAAQVDTEIVKLLIARDKQRFTYLSRYNYDYINPNMVEENIKQKLQQSEGSQQRIFSMIEEQTKTIRDT